VLYINRTVSLVDFSFSIILSLLPFYMVNQDKEKGKGLYLAVNGGISGATECHLPYGITQCYLLPGTSEHTPL